MNKNNTSANVSPEKVCSVSSDTITKVEDTNSIATLEVIDLSNQDSDPQDASKKTTTTIRCITKTIEDVSNGTKQLVKSTEHIFDVSNSTNFQTSLTQHGFVLPSASTTGEVSSQCAKHNVQEKTLQNVLLTTDT